MNSNRYLAVLLGVAFAPDSTTAQSLAWFGRSLSAQPSADYAWSSMAFDAARNRYVLVTSGGATTWEFDGSRWTQRGSDSPPMAESVNLVYDKNRNQVLAVYVRANQEIEVRAWMSGAIWLRLPTSLPPPVRRMFATAYDEARRVVVLFGGTDAIGVRSDTWELDNLQWRQRGSGGPPARHSSAMVYDGRLNRCVLFGGRNPSGPSQQVYADTWEWDGSVWREHFGISAPSKRMNHAMTFDIGRGRTQLYGGWDPDAGGSIATSDLWEWDGTRWSHAPAIRRPSPMAKPAFAYDVTARNAVLFGSERVNNQEVARTWDLLGIADPQATYAVFGSGCQGSAGVPALAAQAGSLPWLGEPFTVLGTNFPTSPLRIPVAVLGASKTVWAGGSLPFDLTPFGAPGCVLGISTDFSLPMSMNNGRVTWTFTVPEDSGLIGGRFYQQFLSVDPSANALGLAMSNSGEGRVGVR